MKKAHLLFGLFFCITLLTSCLKTEHRVRIKNEYPIGLKINIGPANFGTVASGSTTDYKVIPEGSHTISGDYTGSLSITGKGKHDWTMTITSSGGNTFKEDK